MKTIGSLCLPVVSAAALGATAGVLNLTQLLGAHPFWDEQVIWIGIPPGIALAVSLWWADIARTWRVVFPAVGLFGAGLATHLGKMRFAASFAEDRLAGHAWYFGWIAVAGFAAMLSVGLLMARRGA